MPKYRIKDQCSSCYSTTECEIEAENEVEAIKKHKAGESEYNHGDACIAGDEIECEEIE